ncbi:MAG: class I SAM-dependent methyltransferase [Actinomycetota bacterium]|nr:class I SAM-dependent methyltransferase [Actinomycetota bacterium]
MNESHLQYLSSPEWAQALQSELLPWIESAGDLGGDVLEIGPGPGLTTDLLRQRIPRLTAIEVDPELGHVLSKRLAGTNVEVIVTDATRTGLPAERYTAVACFSVLHHMSSADDQDRLFAEVHRVLRPGGIFVGQESLDLDLIRAGHAGDTFHPVGPEDLARRLSAAGFAATRTDVLGYHYRFISQKPA